MPGREKIWRRLCLLGPGLALLAAPALAAQTLTIHSWADHQEFVVPLFKEQHPDTDVQTIRATGINDFIEKQTTMVLSNTPVDVVYVPFQAIRTFIDKGYILDLTPYIRRDARDLGWISEIYRPVYEAGTKDGKVYGFPLELGAVNWWYNIEAFARAGLPSPNDLYRQQQWNWNSMLDLARKLTIPDPNNPNVPQQWGIADHWGDWKGQPWLYQTGGSIYSPDRSTVTLDRPEALKAVSFAHALLHEHRVATPFGSDWQASFRSGRWGMAPWWNSFGIRDSYLSKNSPAKWDVAPFPVGPNGQNMTTAHTHILAISATSRNPELAWQFIKLAGSPPGHLRLMQARGWPAVHRSNVNTWLADAMAQGLRGTPNVVEQMSNIKIYEWLTVDANRLVVQGLADIWSGKVPPSTGLADIARRLRALPAQ